MGVNLPKDLQDFTAGVGLIDVGGVANALANFCCKTTQNGVVASTTQTQAGGTVIRAAITRVTSANASDAVTLGFKATPGTMFVIINDSGNIVSLFPKLGDTLNDAVHDAVNTLADNTISIYACPVSGLWFGGAITLEA